MKSLTMAGAMYLPGINQTSGVESFHDRLDSTESSLHDYENTSLTNVSWADMADMSTPMMWRVVRTLDIYCVPIIITLGIVGNTASFLVFVLTPLKALSSSVYLAALAVSDNGFLICVLGLWLINVNIRLYHRPGWCQMFVYLSYVFGFLSVWYVVCFTVERYIAVCFPFKRSEMCTTRRAKVVVTVMAAVAMAAYSFALWTSDVSKIGGGEPDTFCQHKPAYADMVYMINNIDTIITLILPSLTIIVLNIGIVHKVLVAQRRNKDIQAPSSAGNQRLMLEITPTQRSIRQMATGSNSRMLSVGSGGRSLQNSQITRMLLVVSTMFLLLNLPSHTLRVHQFLASFLQPDYQPDSSYRSWQLLFQFLYYLNFCINFVLYNLCGRNFRLAMCRLLRTASCRKQSSPRTPGDPSSGGRLSWVTNKRHIHNHSHSHSQGCSTPEKASSPSTPPQCMGRPALEKTCLSRSSYYS